MKEIDKLKLKKRFLTGLIGLSTLTVSSYLNGVTANAETQDNTCSICSDIDALSYNSKIEEYSAIFNLKSGIINNKIEELTNNFNDYSWQYGAMINGKQYDSHEEAIISIIKDIYYHPENYDLDKDMITSSNEYETSASPEMMVRKYSEIFNVNECVALSIVYAECGKNVDSYNYLVNNNPAGLGPFMQFENKEMGIIYYISFLKNTCNCKIDSDTQFLTYLGPSYSGGDGSHWIGMTTSFYSNLETDYFYYAPELKRLYYDKYDLNNIVSTSLDPANVQKIKEMSENLEN